MCNPNTISSTTGGSRGSKVTDRGNSSGRNGGRANEINRNKNNNNINGEGNTVHHNQGTRGSSSQGLNMTYEGGGERLARRQQRAGRFRRAKAFEDLSKKVKQFSTAANKNIKNKIKPTNEELRMSVDREWEATTRGSQAHKFRARAGEVSAAIRQQDKIIKTLLSDWNDGGHGYVPLEKEDGTFRLMLENWNSIKLFSELKTKNERICHIEAVRKKYNVDCLAGVETQADWSLADDDKQFSDMFGFGEVSKGRASHNTTEPGIKKKSQPGGTAMMTFGSFSDYVVESKSDDTGLGRWTYQTIKNAYKTVRLIVAYRPGKNPPSSLRRRGIGRHKLGSTVWEQHDRYFRSRGILDKSPREMFDKHLLELLRGWRRDGDEVLLMGDFNEDIYEGELALTLKEEDLLLEEQFRKTFSQDAPFSHFSGSKPICGIFASPGIDCTTAFIDKHKMNGGMGVGDHRLHIFDFSAQSLLGLDTPTMKKPTSRNLRCSVVRTRINYNKVLMQLTNRHRMYKKMNTLSESLDVLSPSEFQILFNKWDKEMTELMMCAEKKCKKFKNSYIPYSPVIGLWTHRLNTYRWIVRYKRGHDCNISNLRRTCRRNDISSPLIMSLEEALTQEEACKKKLEDYRKSAPELRVKHLQERLSAAKKRNDEDSEKAIIQILRREHDRKKYRRLKVAFGKKRSNPASRVAVPCEFGPDAIFSTQEQVEEVCSEKLSERFSEANNCEIGTGQLLQDIGYLGDSAATRDILRGKYVFPPGVSKYTKLLLSEAAAIFAVTTDDMVDAHVTSEDFVSWWSHAKEDIQSSKSGAHFGHYKAASYNKYLTSLQVAKLNLVLRTGIPLERWGHGLTVLLEKEFGSIYIDKLRAICLFEADFNWLCKLIFAKKMMNKGKDKGIIPTEQLAKAGSQSKEGGVIKALSNDINRTLHIPSAVVSADLAQCYDAVNHAMCSIALQAFGVPILAIKFMLICLQTMNFWLRTAFGVADKPFGGTIEFPFMGLGQGCGGAPSSFTADSALMINAYKRLGHGCNYTSCLTGAMFFFAAILYVDDTDLLLRAPTPTSPTVVLYKLIQRAINDWAELIMATGGSCKPKKCHVTVTAFKFVKGKAEIMSNAELPKVQFTVPQKGGLSAPIEMNDPKASKTTLGITANSAGLPKDHLAEIEKKGLEWSARLNSNKFLKPADGWLSLGIQLKPTLEYGLECLSAEPKEVNEVLDRIYFRSLGKLRVNKNIRKEFRTLPKMYQGLGMFDLNIDSLGMRIFFLRRHWKQPTPLGNLLQQAYEAFLMDVGLEGNVLARNYKILGKLAERCWFKTLWSLCYEFDVVLRIHESNDIHLTRKNDKSIMECLINSGVYGETDLARLGRYCKFKQVFSLADIVECDGRTICPKVLLHQKGNSSRVFSYEQPTVEDHKLWTKAIKAISDPSYRLTTKLGVYINERHVGSTWYISHNNHRVYTKQADGTITVYRNTEEGQMTRNRRVYEIESVREDILFEPSRQDKYASVDDFDENFVTLKSHASFPSQIQPSTDFWDVLHSWPNQSLWRHFHCDGDGSWIRRSLLTGSLQLVHDGSYMAKIDPKICSAAFILKCKMTGNSAVGSLVEKSDEADNYRAEALGSLAGLLVIRAASQLPLPYKACQAFCDNKGIVNHGSASDQPLKEKQVHADVISLIKQYTRELPCEVSYEHVYGHLDDILTWEQLTPVQKLNVQMDALAKRALLSSLCNRQFIDVNFPFEQIVLQVGGKKVVSSPTTAIYNWWGHKTARKLFHSKKIVDKSLFDLIYWPGMDKVMNKHFPRMFGVFVTKHVSGCCGCNAFLSLIDPTVKNICPSCGLRGTPGESTASRGGETTEHIVQCRDPGRTELYQQSVDELVEWLQKHHTDPNILDLIEIYLRRRGTATMTSLAGPLLPQKYRLLCKYQDKLGWKNMIEGRFLSYYVELQRDYLRDIDTYTTAESWATGLMERLIKITHKQWLYRNSTVHFKSKDGRTLAEHEKIKSKIEKLLLTDPDDLLEEDVALLHEDVTELAEATAVDQEYWIASMETAVLAAYHKRKFDRIEDACTDLECDYTSPQKDGEGSLRFRKRKKK